MNDPRIDTMARSLAKGSSRRQMLRVVASCVGATGAALFTRRQGAAKPWHPSDCAAHPEVCVCSGLGQACSTFADCCNAGDGDGKIKCVDNTCQCCHGGRISCGRYSNKHICHDPYKSMGLCCIGFDCVSPDASCVWVGCKPGVDPDCDPSRPYNCPPGYELTVGAGGPAPPGYCPRRRPPRRSKRRRNKRRS